MNHQTLTDKNMITLELYSFDELTKEAQMIDLEENREMIGKEHYNITTTEELIKVKTDTLECLGFEDVEIFYSLKYKKEGVYFTSLNVDLKILIEKIFPEYKRIINVLDKSKLSLKITKSQYSLSTNKFSTRKTFTYDLNIKNEFFVFNLIHDFQFDFKQWYYTFCDELFKQIESERNYYFTDKFVINTFLECDYYFTKDGKLINFL